MKKFILLIMMVLMLVGCGEDKVITSVKGIQIGESGQTMEDLTLDYINAMMLYNIATPENGAINYNIWRVPGKVYDLKASREEIVRNVSARIDDSLNAGKKNWDKNHVYSDGWTYRETVVFNINNVFEEYNKNIDEIHNLYETRIKGKYTPLKKEDIEWFSKENGMGETIIKAMAVVNNVSYSVIITPVIEPNGYIYVTNDRFKPYIGQTGGRLKAELVMNLYEAFPDILDWRIKEVTEDFMEVN